MHDCDDLDVGGVGKFAEPGRRGIGHDRRLLSQWIASILAYVVNALRRSGLVTRRTALPLKQVPANDFNNLLLFSFFYLTSLNFTGCGEAGGFLLKHYVCSFFSTDTGKKEIERKKKKEYNYSGH